MRNDTLLAATLMLGALVASAPASAELITTTGGGPVAIDTANTNLPSTITLDPASQSVTVGGQFTQGVFFDSGYDSDAGPVPFSISETINSVLVTITGTMNVSQTADPDSITLNAGSPIVIGDLVFTSEALTFLDNPPFPGGTETETLTFDVTSVPEPASLAILATGLIGFGMMRRRRGQAVR